jgi:hypothetical protein
MCVSGGGNIRVNKKQGRNKEVIKEEKTTFLGRIWTVVVDGKVFYVPK